MISGSELEEIKRAFVRASELAFETGARACAAYNIENSRVDLVGWGRMAIDNPGFPREILEDGSLDSRKVCVTCSGCSKLLGAGMHVGCVVQNPEIYRESMITLNKGRK